MKTTTERDKIGPLLIRLMKAHRGVIADRLSMLGLYPGQDGLLYHLSQNNGLTMTELTDKLSIRHSTLFTMVTRMETSGLIEKEKDKTDRRTSRIYLTRKGRKQMVHIAQIWQEIEKQLSKGLNKEEKATTIAVLRKLINNLNHK